MSHTTLSDAVGTATDQTLGAEQGATGPTPDQIMQLGLGFWGSKALLSAVELGLFSELAAAGALDADALRHRLELNERSARDFFDALVALGMLERTDGRYRNTEATELFLDRAKPSYVGGILEMSNARLYGYWGSLTEGLRTGTPQNEIKTGGDFFDVVYADPAKLRGFVKAMTGISAGAAQAIAAAFPWERHQTFIDIGCAEGCLPIAVARAHRHITGGGFDLPAVGPFFDGFVAQAGLDSRLRFHPGDFFSDPLPSADVLCMGHILHDWDMDEKRVLLQKAYDALPASGALIVYDAIIDDQRRENAFGLLMSLTMLIETPGGFDYTGADCQRWMRQIGFRESYVRPLVGPDSMVVGIK
jgi:O-methyltransferase domain/Dimerisation domain